MPSWDEFEAVAEPEQGTPWEEFEPVVEPSRPRFSSNLPDTKPSVSVAQTTFEPMRIAERPEDEFNLDRGLVSREAMQAAVSANPNMMLAERIPMPESAREFVQGAKENTVDLLTGLTSPKSIAMAPLFAIPYVGEALALKLGAEAAGAGAGRVTGAIETGNPRELGAGVVDVAGGASMIVPGAAGLRSRISVPRELRSAIQTADQAGLTKSAEAAAKAAVETGIERTPDAQTIRSDTGQVREGGRQVEGLQNQGRENLQQPAPEQPGEPARAPQREEREVPLNRELALDDLIESELSSAEIGLANRSPEGIATLDKFQKELAARRAGDKANPRLLTTKNRLDEAVRVAKDQIQDEPVLQKQVEDVQRRWEEPLVELENLPPNAGTARAMELGAKVSKEQIPAVEAIVKRRQAEALREIERIDSIPEPTAQDLIAVSDAGTLQSILAEALRAAKFGEKPATLARERINETTTKPGMGSTGGQAAFRSDVQPAERVPSNERKGGAPVEQAQEKVAQGSVLESAGAAEPATVPEGTTAAPANLELVSMGGKAPSDPLEVRKAELAQLTDSIKTLAESNPRPQLSKAFAVGEALGGIKDRATAALDGLRAAGAWMKARLEGKPVVTDFNRALGDRHLALSESSVNARKWMKDAQKAIPDPKTREAISNWVDAGGDAAILDRAAAETKPQYKSGYEAAKKLTPEQKTIAANLKNYFDSRLQEAIDAGVLEEGIENYIHRSYEAESPWKKGVIAELRSGIFTGRPALAKKRVFEYDFEAEKLGKKPVKDFAKRVVAYDLALNKAIADRQAVRDMMEIKMPDGRPMIDVGGGGKIIEGDPGAVLINRSRKPSDLEKPEANRGDYKSYDQPALRKWKWATNDANGNPILVQGDVLIHPDAIGQIRTLFEPSAIRRNPVGRAALGFSSTIKQTMLDLSGFHPVQIAVHGTEHRTFKPVKEIDFTNPDVRGLIRGGAVVGETTGRAAFEEGLSGSSLTRHIPVIGERLQAYNSWLFEDYIPRLKVAMGLHALERNRARFKNLSEEQLYQMTADQMNAAFGEQNYTMLGRSKTTQDALRLALLAPDFLEARSRFTSQAFTKYGAEQRQALLLGAAAMYITARLMNKVLDDEYHFEPKNAFNIVHGGKSYGLRTIQGDLIHAVTEPGQFVNHRLNPVYGKPALEFLTGRDYFGRKRTVAEQAKDLAATPIPISAKGLVSGGEQTLFESFLNAFGLVTKRDSPSSDMAAKAAEWKKKNDIKTEPGEFIYDAEKDPYRQTRLAAERGDIAGVRSEVTKLMNEGKTRKQIIKHFTLSEKHRFTGSAANEKRFVESLTEDQKKIYRDATEERKRITRAVIEALQ